MGDPVLWLGGWASGLGCWRSVLESLYPRREHIFLDSHAILEAPGLLALAVKGLPANGTLAAWSLGSLILHQALARGNLDPHCRILSVSPIFDFCRAGGPWPKAALIRMARRLPRDQEAVLAEFWNLSMGNTPVTHAQESAWLLQARSYSLAALLQGLEFLGGTVVDRGAIPLNPRHLFLASPQDPLAPTPRGVFPGKEWIGYSRGHMPFLDYPELLTPLLNEGRDTVSGGPQSGSSPRTDPT